MISSSCSIRRQLKTTNNTQTHKLEIDSSKLNLSNKINILDSLELSIVTTEFYRQDSLSPPLKSIQTINLKKKSRYDNSISNEKESIKIEKTATQ